MWRNINLALSILWGLAIPVALVTGWVYSLLFISVCSIYANMASHIAAWRSDVPDE